MLSTLDNHQLTLASQKEAARLNLDEHEKRLQATLKDVENVKHSKKGKQNLYPGGGLDALMPSSQGDDMMEVDDMRGLLSPQSDGRGKKSFMK